VVRIDAAMRRAVASENEQLRAAVLQGRLYFETGRWCEDFYDRSDDCKWPTSDGRLPELPASKRPARTRS
jgi:hypothetical protein